MSSNIACGIASTITMPISNVDVAPTMELDFATGTLDPRITFTRATTGSYYDSAGVLTQAAVNAPRFDYDPVTLQPKGLLIEESRTNLLTYSEQFDNAAWTRSSSSVTSNVVIAPDGNTTADKLLLNNGQAPASTRSIYQTLSGVTGTYTISIFAKTAEFRLLRISILTAANTTLIGPTFNTDNGTYDSLGSATSASITPKGNGWYQCVATFDFLTGATVPRVYFASTQATGDGTSGIYIWGAQLEAGSFATSYIPTVASQVTRAADVAVMTGTNFSSWYNQSEGSFYSEFDNPATANKRLFSANDGTTSNRVSASLSVGSSGSINYTVTQGGTAQVNALLLKTNLGTGSNAFYKTSISYKQDDFAGCVNAETVVTYTSGTVPIVNTQLTIGVNELSNSAWLNGHIKRITYFNKRLANSALQYLTR